MYIASSGSYFGVTALPVSFGDLISLNTEFWTLWKGCKLFRGFFLPEVGSIRVAKNSLVLPAMVIHPFAAKRLFHAQHLPTRALRRGGAALAPKLTWVCPLLARHLGKRFSLRD
jgi:hypothetical protein